MSHKKAGGSTRLGRDSQAKRLGIKLHDGETARAGMVIVRQHGTKVHPGQNVKKGKDDTLYAGLNGKVKFRQHKRKRFDGAIKMARFVSVIKA